MNWRFVSLFWLLVNLNVFCEGNLTFVRKCCNISEAIYEPQGDCVQSNLSFNPHLSFSSEKIDIVFGRFCDYGQYLLDPDLDKDDDYEILPDGYLIVNLGEKIPPKEYCLETIGGEYGNGRVLPLVCFPPPPPTSIWANISPILFPICCLISVPFLISISSLYFGVAELRNTYGKVLGIYAACLALSYTSLATVQISGSVLPQPVCIFMAYLIQFSFISCFFWLNLLCYHTWRKMTKCLKTKNAKPKSNVRFILYSAYAWGVPTLIFLITIIMDYSPSIPATYLKPNIGLDKCWFKTEKSVFPFFYGPISLILVINVIFFILTARFLRKNCAKRSRMEHMHDVVLAVVRDSKKKVFFKCLLLFCAMGLNWILELLSWGIGGPPGLWIITDIINTLQGPIMFWIFVWSERKVRLHIRFCKQNQSHHDLQMNEEPLVIMGQQY